MILRPQRNHWGRAFASMCLTPCSHVVTLFFLRCSPIQIGKGVTISIYVVCLFVPHARAGAVVQHSISLWLASVLHAPSLFQALIGRGVGWQGGQPVDGIFRALLLCPRVPVARRETSSAVYQVCVGLAEAPVTPKPAAYFEELLLAQLKEIADPKGKSLEDAASSLSFFTLLTKVLKLSHDEQRHVKLLNDLIVRVKESPRRCVHRSVGCCCTSTLAPLSWS